MTGTIVLTAEELVEVKATLAAHLPEGTRVGVFGSRAGGRCKPMSDLDLVLGDTGAIPLAVLAALAEAFDESPLRFKVDLVDRSAVSPAFGQVIDATRIDLEH